MKKYFVGLIIVLVCAAVSTGAIAAPVAKNLTPDEREKLASVADYLNSITSMQASFLQISSTGDTAEGTILLSRPKHLRIDYDPPTPVIIVANGKFLSYVDTELEQINHIPVDDTPAAFLLRDTFAFDDGVLTVTSFERQANTIRVGMVQTADPLAGELSMVVTENPMVLRKWTVTDAQGVVTSVTLINPRFGFPISKDKFQADYLQIGGN